MSNGVKLKLIRLPVDLHTRLVRQARHVARQHGQRASVNAVIVDILLSHFDRRLSGPSQRARALPPGRR